MQPIKKEKNFWVVLDNEDYEKLNNLAESKNVPLKEFAGNILKKNLISNKEIAVILKIPKEKISSMESLQEWMSQQTKVLIGLLSKKNN
jgi:hypothetical protein